MNGIRRVHGDERLNTAFTLYPYAFDATPAPAAAEQLRGVLPYHEGNHTLIAEQDGRTLATAAAIPAHQNLRGAVLPTAAVAWVATHPGARRQGHSRALMHRLHADMLATGHRLAVLYPFHPSFYERFGYIGLPLNRTASFPPEGLTPLLDVRLPGEVTWQRIDEGYETYRAFHRRLLAQRHGFLFTPDYRAVRALAVPDRWLATATVGGETVGLLTYRVDGYGGCLHADEMLYTGALGRALLLQFLAQHTHQVTRIEVTVAPGELPETWAASLTVRTAAETSYPTSPPLMGRLLSIDALRGAACGPGRLEVELAGDRLLTGRHLLDGTSGRIDVRDAPGGGDKAVLTAAGLAGLAYGVLDPVDVVARGLGEIPDGAAEQLRALLPPCTPYALGKG